MNNSILLKSGSIINEGKQFVADILIKNGRIEKIAPSISVDYKIEELNLEGKYNLVSNTSITSRITFSNIQFNGIASSSLGYVMLDGLQPGKNFLWTMDLTKRISSFIEMSVQYEGRRSGSSGLVNIGRAQIRAIL